jgi:hypothetical protein
MVVHEASSTSGGHRRTGESALWHSRSSEPGKEVGDRIQDHVRFAGQQRLTAVATGEDSDRLEAECFARRNINRAVSNHHRLLGWHMEMVKGTPQVLRVRLDKTNDLPWEKDITERVDGGANRAHRGLAITGHHTDFETSLPKGLQNL